MRVRLFLLVFVFCMTLGLHAQEEVQEVWVGQEYKCDLNSVVSDIAPFNISWDIDASIFSTRKEGTVCYVTPKRYFPGTVALTCTFSFTLGGIPIVHEPIIWYFSCIDNSLSISPAEMRLTVGGTGKIRYNHSNDAYAPFAAVNFASDNQDVAIVSSDGTVKAVKEGSTRIAVHSNLAKEEQYCRVIVEGTAPLPVITFDEHQLEMDIDKTATIGYSIEPTGSYTVTWSSSDESVATVTQSGKVKALKKGKATITAKIDGYESSDACEVTVRSPRPTSIDIPEDSYSIFVGESLTISPVVKPEGAEYTLIWKSSDQDVATVSQTGVVTAKNIGETRITATIQGENRSDYCYVYVDKPTLTLKASLPSSVVNKATRITLTASDSRAQIWYTLDGSSPISSGTKKLYSSPFIINESMRIKAVAVHPDYNNSDILTLNYTLRTTPGDVNRDGEANIADINTIIDVVLDGADDEMEYLLCDVNNDSEVNIADINTDLDVILNPEKYILNVETFVANGVPFNMIYVEGGTFTMGSNDDESDPFSGYPAHEVTVSSFQMGETEVTQELWEAIMGYNPSYYSKQNGYPEAAHYPVDRVSWNECQEFIKKLNELTGRNFRLPTEAEWEFAARGGNKSDGGLGITGGGWYFDYEWHYDNPGYWDEYYHTTTVGQYRNELGLCDMAGNVEEWCYDWYSDYTTGVQVNPIGPMSGTKRSVRGNSFAQYEFEALNKDAVWRDCREPNEKCGFRIILSDIEIFTINDISFAMIPVRAGTFSMGATAEQVDEAESDEIPAHQVTLSSYSIGQTEVTNALWKAVMGQNVYGDPESPYETSVRIGAISLYLDELSIFMQKLNQFTGMEFRLPTEAEWEFAARGGILSKGYKYAGSNNINEVAWYSGNSGNMLHKVASKVPNELGIYDMSGNAIEICDDYYYEYTADSQWNPGGGKLYYVPFNYSYGNALSLRGGYYGYHSDDGRWECIDKWCRVSTRWNVCKYWYGFNLFDYDDIQNSLLPMGFRLVLSSRNTNVPQ